MIENNVENAMSRTSSNNADPPRKRRSPRLNFRPLLFCAAGMCMGIFIYLRARFGHLAFSDFLFSGGLLFVAAFPLSRKRLAAMFLCVAVCAGMGAAASHLYCVRYFSGAEEGTYEIEGTVSDFACLNGRTEAVLTGLTLDGRRVGGKLSAVILSEEVRPGDRLRFTAKVGRAAPPSAYDNAPFVDGVRYETGSVEAERTGGGNFLYALSGRLYDVLHMGMGTDEADLTYALLTGNARNIDGGLLRSVRRGGIAHIFAVSGLHIGILYGAVKALFFFLKRRSAYPALAVALFYTAFCGFSVSAVRALVMCAAHALNGMARRKSDFLNALSLAALIILFFRPAEWLSAGFRLSFGACLGLALFSGTVERGLKKLRCPAFLARCFSSSLSVQILTFPVLMESFGYVSVWGTLLNLVLIPVMPVYFLGAMLPALFAVAVPSAAAVLVIPEGLSSALLFVFSRLDVSFVLTGFSLGMGGTVWFSACVALSGRVRMGRMARLGAAGMFCTLFAVFLVLQNVVFMGCKLTATERRGALLVLLRTPDCSVLVLDDAASFSDCEDFLMRNLYVAPDYAVVVTDNEERAIGVAAFTGAKKVYAMTEIQTGLQREDVAFLTEMALGGMLFRYEGAHKLTVLAEELVVEIDFSGFAVLAADLSVEKGAGDLNFFLHRGIIKAL